MFDDDNRPAQPVDPMLHDPRSGDFDETPAAGSLADDVGALLEDGRTYLEAELAFQKSRLGFVGNKSKQGVVYGVAALALVHLALIGLVVGLVLALAPIVTPLGATAMVAGLLLIGAFILAKIAMKRFASASAVMKDGSND